MARSRSSFDDLSNAIASATALGPAEQKSPPTYQGVTLVSFGTSEEPPEPTQKAQKATGTAKLPPPGPDLEPSEDLIAVADAGLRLPRLPELEGLVSPAARCERVLQWIVEATGAGDVFLADSAGLPMAGAIADAEARMAAAGVVASAVLELAAALPGATSSIFELHVGEGPFFELIGLAVGSSIYLVGLTRKTKLTPLQVHGIRLACQHALGKGMMSGA